MARIRRRVLPEKLRWRIAYLLDRLSGPRRRRRVLHLRGMERAVTDLATTSTTTASVLVELERMRGAADAVRAVIAGDPAQLHHALASLDRRGFAEVLDQLDGVIAWAADLLTVIEEHVAEHLDTVDDDLLYTQTRHLADVREVLTATVATLDPARPRTPPFREEDL